MMYIKLKSQSGVATLIALVMMTMLTLIAIAALNTSDDEVSIAGN
jgi:Tfp pilus assembly protein PilX